VTETRARYETDRELRDKWLRPAPNGVIASLVIMRGELRRRHVIVFVAEKPSVGQAERDLATFTWLLQLFPVRAPEPDA
jgi:hypothetical protein